MDPQRTPTHPLSRRQFLANAASFAGTALAPAILLPGCQKRAAVVTADDFSGTVLRAGRFSAAPDGRSREVWGYNGQLPGPVIRVKDGEKVRFKVVNELGDVSTSVHWHGMHQPGTWTMDGVEDVSRSPIPPGSSFIYEFTATPPGTHWYHSHVGVQYGNGLFGPLIVEEPTPIATYDRDEIVFLTDWFLEAGDVLLARVLKGMEMKMPMKDKMDMKEMKRDLGDVPFQSALINGKGRAPGDTTSPLAVLEVKKGETVRLRLINGSSTYQLRFRVDNHPLTVIATDGAPMEPVAVDNLVINVGERFDVLLKADQDGAHWVRAATLDGKEARAVLRYAGATGEPESAPAHWGEHALKPDEMKSRAPVVLAERPKEISLLLGGSMMPYRWSVNEQFFPKADPIALEKDESIRFHFRNPTGMDHPFHLHGHYFHVLGKPGALNLKDPVQKDTVNVPAKEELVIQWKANNPGRWFFHCHIEWHLAAGMARVVEIKPY
ncbi:MAG: multicopper oxidase family protein [Gemmataceae bacterium]|nr:multicopper oxidase family protein [Gemmataceae bacterium]